LKQIVTPRQRGLTRAQFLQLSAGALAIPAAGLAPAQAAAIQLARPTRHQLAFHDLELGAFIHYSIDAYAKRGATHGGTPASEFNPSALDVEQWVLAAKGMGASWVVLTARHEEGFCLWPTTTTDYSVRSTRYQGGQGDIVREFVDACRKHGVKPGLYTAPWIDSHWEAAEAGYRGGDTGRIDKFDDPAIYAKALAKEQQQLRELMTGYGPLVFVWADHFGRSDSLGDVPQGGKLREFYATLAKLAHSLQPDCLFFGPDVEHVGNEEGRACYPLWNAMNTLDGTNYTISTTYKWGRDNSGDPLGKFYRPHLGTTTDGLSTGGWMWHGPRQVQPLERRMQVYYETIGRGAGVLVNLAPDRRGLVPANLVTAAREFGDEIRRRFGSPVVQSKAKDPQQTLRFPAPHRIDHVVTMEELASGQAIAKYLLEAQVDGQWRTLVEGRTIGHKRIDRFSPVTATAVRFSCTSAIADPVEMRSIAVYDSSRA
jgi:alpha-L-fucosidase